MSRFELQNFKVVLPSFVVSCEDVSIEAGEWLVLRAPSGFGKSTLLRGILGLEKTEGKVILGTRVVSDLPVHHRKMGVVFQEQLLFPHLNAIENALFGVRLRRRLGAQDRERAEKVFADLDLSHRLRAPVSELSGGERQRVALIRALLLEPDLLLFDEPFRGMDSALILKCKNLIDAQLSTKAVPVVWITHQNEFEPVRKKELLGGAFHDGGRHFQYDSGQFKKD